MPTGTYPACPLELAANSLSVLGEADFAVLVGVLSLILSLVLSTLSLLRGWEKGKARRGAGK